MRITMVWLLLAALLSTGGVAGAETFSYELDPAHSEVTFKVRHLTSRVSGRFNEFTGEVEADPARPAAARVEFKIKADSIDTGVEKRDAHLRGSDFFDVEKYPEITFKSETIVDKGNGQYEVRGPLTMHGVTKPVVLNVKAEGPMKTPWGKDVVGFGVTGTINRKDFGIVWNTALDTGGYVLGDEVAIDINLEASAEKRKEEAAAAPAKK